MKTDYNCYYKNDPWINVGPWTVNDRGQLNTWVQRMFYCVLSMQNATEPLDSAIDAGYCLDRQS